MGVAGGWESSPEGHPAFILLFPILHKSAPRLASASDRQTHSAEPAVRLGSGIRPAPTTPPPRPLPGTLETQECPEATLLLPDCSKPQLGPPVLRSELVADSPERKTPHLVQWVQAVLGALASLAKGGWLGTLVPAYLFCAFFKLSLQK